MAGRTEALQETDPTATLSARGGGTVGSDPIPALGVETLTGDTSSDSPVAGGVEALAGDTNGDGRLDAAEYEARVLEVVDEARRSFVALSTADPMLADHDRISVRSLWHARGAGGEIDDAAKFLLDNPSVLQALDVADDSSWFPDSIDGQIGMGDLEGFGEQVREEGLWAVLADTAGGSGTNDEEWGQGDLDAMIADASLPEELRARARATAPNACGPACAVTGAWRLGAAIVDGVWDGAFELGRGLVWTINPLHWDDIAKGLWEIGETAVHYAANPTEIPGAVARAWDAGWTKWSNASWEERFHMIGFGAGYAGATFVTGHAVNLAKTALAAAT